MKGRAKFLPVLLLLFSFLMLAPRSVFACDFCVCEPAAHASIIVPTILEQHAITIEHLVEEFDDQEEFFFNPANLVDQTRVWGGYLLPAWMMMTEQLVHTAMYQTLIIGSLLDAKQQLEAQTLFQKLAAEAHQDYQPSHGMCVFGTNIRSLAEAERNYEYTTFVMSQRSMDRQMGNMNSAAARGQFDDHCFRLRQFRRRYCDLRDNNDRMLWICDPEEAADGAGQPLTIQYPECLPADNEITNATKNKDISFTRTIDRANTLEIDFYDPGQDLTADEEDMFALANNLYSHEIMFRLPESSMSQRGSQDELLDMRNIIAKRSVAEHSFNTIVGMKAEGKGESSELTYPYMKLILEQLGLDEEPSPGSDPERSEIELYLGDYPSYYAQMEILTKRLYQSPDFFTNLYDEPVNVERKGVALQAIGLMQDFDTWNSYLRTEAMLSVMLELELLRINSQVQNQMRTMRGGGIEL